MNKHEIRELMRFFDKSDITKVKIKDGDFSIELQKGFEGGVVMTSAPSSISTCAPVSSLSQASKQETALAPVTTKTAELSLKSPMVGTFYKAPSPTSEPFVKVGSIVKKGQPIGIIEAMKIMNEIEAEFDCRILEMLAEDGQPVEFDMPLFAVEKV
ncbi:MAG: acetyl-CoA carboxylase biotin carboxyl carrier protein [Sulfurospirillaceae bacterium]|nr:acetyl-CoA carboxylase biotin carboxyl carrier protein [Sulfurospirillaceae bacterium]MDD3463181.1 acetyl-CoA carboxylase biotin carboxyl carrier protein [Sulfurospirillaceae bacterium]